MRVGKDSNLGELTAKYPEAAKIMREYGLSCAGCFAAAFDTLEQGAKIHGLTEEEIKEMISRINQALKQK